MILARVGDKKQNKTVNMAKIVFFRGGGGGGVSEIQCVIFQQNNVSPYGIYMESAIIFFRK